MYAIVEFEKKECAVVPVIWLTEDQTKCYWPNAKESVFIEMVRSKVGAKQSWSKYKIIKILKVSDNYEDAVMFLDKCIEEASSTTNHSASILTTKKHYQDFSSDDEAPTSSKKIRISQQDEEDNRSLPEVRLEKSSDEFSEDETSKVSDVPTHISTATTVTVSPSTSGIESSPYSQGSLLEVVLTHLEHIKAVQDQMLIKMENIDRNQQTSVIQQLRRPASIPTLPVSNKQEYKALEEFLVDENNALYMRRRLAAIGGSSVRNTVMNVLKFLLTNKVAMKFNWSGRDKRPFKDTRMMHVINEAVKLSYSGREPSDLTDTDINNAVKDWLKLAKHRFLYSRR